MIIFSYSHILITQEGGSVEERTYNLVEAAEALGWAVETVRRHIQSGEIQAEVTPRGLLRKSYKIPQREIDRIRAKLRGTPEGNSYASIAAA